MQVAREKALKNRQGVYGVKGRNEYDTNSKEKYSWHGGFLWRNMMDSFTQGAYRWHRFLGYRFAKVSQLANSSTLDQAGVPLDRN